MEPAERHRQQPLVRLLVPQVLHLNHLELKVLPGLELEAQVLEQEQQAQPVQGQEELVLEEPQALEEPLVQLEGLGQVLVQRLNQPGRLAERMW